jgi:outer membrane protein
LSSGRSSLLDERVGLPISDSPVTMKRHPSLARRGLVALAALSGALFTPPISAQPSPPAAPPAGAAAPRQPLPGQPVPAPTAPAAPTLQAPPPAGPDLLALALAPQPGGLTPEETAKVAAKTKHSVRAKRADLEAAAAKVDQALVTFFPRLSVTASYTRLSEVPSSGLGGGGALVGASAPGPLLVGPCKGDTTMTKTCLNDSAGNPAAGAKLSFPVLLNSISFVASLSVPISDYVLRVSQGYASALHAEKGKRLELEAETLLAASDAKLAYFNWVQSRGQVVVAKGAVEQGKAHVTDANRSFQVGVVSRADVLRLEAQVAAAQQFQAEVEAFAGVAEEQLRIALGLPSDRALAIGTDVMHEQGAQPTETLQAFMEQALARRLEIRALDETILSLKETVNLARAGYFPRLDAFADATLANPNQRIFPSQDRFVPTWDAGVRLSWTINDTFTALGATAEAKARVASVEEQKGALRDGLRLEVSAAFMDMQKAAVSIEAAERQLAAAAESARVRNELFKNGKATSTDLIDAENEVTRAQLGRLNARIGLLRARVRLDHVTGRDVPPRPAGE